MSYSMYDPVTMCVCVPLSRSICIQIDFFYTCVDFRLYVCVCVTLFADNKVNIKWHVKTCSAFHCSQNHHGHSINWSGDGDGDPSTRSAGNLLGFQFHPRKSVNSCNDGTHCHTSWTAVPSIDPFAKCCKYTGIIVQYGLAPTP